MITTPAEMTPSQFRLHLIANPKLAIAWIDDILTPAEVVRDFPAISSSVKGLRDLRYHKRGPRFIPAPAGIRYRRLDCIQFLESLIVDPQQPVRRGRRRLRSLAAVEPFGGDP